MINEVGMMDEALIATSTSIGLLSRMCSSMRNKVALTNEVTVAMSAGVRLLPSMDPSMYF